MERKRSNSGLSLSRSSSYSHSELRADETLEKVDSRRRFSKKRSNSVPHLDTQAHSAEAKPTAVRSTIGSIAHAVGRARSRATTSPGASTSLMTSAHTDTEHSSHAARSHGQAERRSSAPSSVAPTVSAFSVALSSASTVHEVSMPLDETPDAVQPGATSDASGSVEDSATMLAEAPAYEHTTEADVSMPLHASPRLVDEDAAAPRRSASRRKVSLVRKVAAQQHASIGASDEQGHGSAEDASRAKVTDVTESEGAEGPDARRRTRSASSRKVRSSTLTVPGASHRASSHKVRRSTQAPPEASDSSAMTWHTARSTGSHRPPDEGRTEDTELTDARGPFQDPDAPAKAKQKPSGRRSRSSSPRPQSKEGGSASSSSALRPGGSSSPFQDADAPAKVVHGSASSSSTSRPHDSRSPFQECEDAPKPLRRHGSLFDDPDEVKSRRRSSFSGLPKPPSPSPRTKAAKLIQSRIRRRQDKTVPNKSPRERRLTWPARMNSNDAIDEGIAPRVEEPQTHGKRRKSRRSGRHLAAALPNGGIDALVGDASASEAQDGTEDGLKPRYAGSDSDSCLSGFSSSGADEDSFVDARSQIAAPDSTSRHAADITMALAKHPDLIEGHISRLAAMTDDISEGDGPVLRRTASGLHDYEEGEDDLEAQDRDAAEDPESVLLRRHPVHGRYSDLRAPSEHSGTSSYDGVPEEDVLLSGDDGRLPRESGQPPHWGGMLTVTENMIELDAQLCHVESQTRPRYESPRGVNFTCPPTPSNLWNAWRQSSPLVKQLSCSVLALYCAVVAMLLVALIRIARIEVLM